MAFKEIFHFDEQAYKIRVHGYGKEKSYEKLAQREVLKRRRVYSTGVKIVFCSLLLFPTAGATGFGLFIGLRQRSIARKKYQHVVDAMRAHGFPLPEPRKRDKLIPLAINVVVYSLSLGLLYGLEDVGIIFANETAEAGFQGTANLVDPSMAGEAHAFINSPADFAQGVLHGAHTQTDELQGLVNPDQTMIEHVVLDNMQQPITETSYAYMSGETAGAQLAPVVERLVTVTVASETLEKAAKSGLDKYTRRKPTPAKDVITVTEMPIAAKVA